MERYQWAENEIFQKITKTAYQKAAIAIAGTSTAGSPELKMCGLVLSGEMSTYELSLGLVTVDAIYNQLEANQSLVDVDFIYNDVAGQFPVYAKAINEIK